MSIETDFLERILKNDSYREEVSKEIDVISSELRAGWEPRKILAFMKDNSSIGQFKIELAKGRISASRRFTNPERLWLDQYSSRYSTPEIISKYRSERLKESKIVDIGSGAGMQSIFFGMHSDTVGVEAVKQRYLLSMINRISYEDSKVSFMNFTYPGNEDNLVLDKNTVIFSDPLRGEGKKSDLSTLTPDPRVIYHHLIQKVKGIAFDLPIMMRPESIEFPGELEFISVAGAVSRLTFYSQTLAKGTRSALILPQGVSVTGEPKPIELEPGLSVALCIPDPALVKSGLLHLFLQDEDARIVSRDDRRLVLSSETGMPEVPGEHFEIIFESNYDGLLTAISNLGARKVIPRFNVPPEEYYPLVRKLNSGAESGDTVYILKHENNYLICKKSNVNKTAE